MGIQFDPKDKDTIAFLKAVGFSDGELEAEGCPLLNALGLGNNDDEKMFIDDKKWRNGPFLVLGQEDGKEGDDRFRLSPAEARIGLGLIQQYGNQPVASLFRKDLCPGTAVPPDGIISNAPNRITSAKGAEQMAELILNGNATVIMLNLLKHKAASIMESGGALYPHVIAVYSSSYCSYDASTDLLLQRGLHFPVSRVPPAIAKANGAVFGVFGGGKLWGGLHFRGTAVLVSDEGYLLTAKHVVKGVLNNDEESGLSDNGKIIPRKEIDVVYVDPQLDIAILKVPGLSHRSYLQLQSPLPNTGEQVWIIGFPPELGATFRLDRPALSATGLVVQNQKNDPNLFYTDVQGSPGYSGGAIVDSQGRLLAITVVGTYEGLSGGVMWGAVTGTYMYGIIPPENVLRILNGSGEK